MELGTGNEFSPGRGNHAEGLARAGQGSSGVRKFAGLAAGANWSQQVFEVWRKAQCGNYRGASGRDDAIR